MIFLLVLFIKSAECGPVTLYFNETIDPKLQHYHGMYVGLDSTNWYPVKYLQNYLTKDTRLYKEAYNERYSEAWWYRTYPDGGYAIENTKCPFYLRMDHNFKGSSDNSSGPEFSCAATLIHHNFALTSASCGAKKTYVRDIRLYAFTDRLSLVETDAFIIRGFYFEDFWITHFPDICVVQFETQMEFNEESQMPKLLHLPVKRKNEVKWYFKTCMAYGHDTWTWKTMKLTIVLPSRVLSSKLCRKLYAVHGDTNETKVKYDGLFCMKFEEKLKGPRFFSEGGPVLCDNELMGIVIYTDMFANENDTYRLIVAIRVDRYLENIARALDFERPTTIPTMTKYPDDVTNTLGEPLDILVEGTTESRNEFASKAKRTAVMLFFLVCFLVILIFCCYCSYVILRCKCSKRQDKILLEPEKSKEMDLSKQDRFSKVDEVVTVAPVTTLMPIKPKRVQWCNPKTTFQDTVIPFFLCLLAVILHKQIAHKFAPGFRHPKQQKLREMEAGDVI